MVSSATPEMDLRTVSRRELNSDSRYMTSLLVFKENKPCLELEAANIDPYHLKIKDKIVATLKRLTFREQHVLVQFWWPYEFGKHELLTTIDQPYGVGVLDERLSSYRRDSEGRSFNVDKGPEKEDGSPVARVFRRGVAEWTCESSNYTPKLFQQQECAIKCNLHGYLALPVFDLNSRLCVGVLEFLASSKYMNYAHEVQQIHIALKTQNLTSPQGFGFPSSYVPNEHGQICSDRIYSILKMACDIHNLPLAQTWAMSQDSSFVSHEKVIRKSCSSFDTRCVGKACMFTADLPFYVKDLGTWSFRDACRVRHLDSSRGFVGKVLLTRGSCFCGDVTELSEEEYPLVHNARMNGLTSCFTIFLRANDDYVLEFFLPPDIKDSEQVLNLVQTLKQNIPIGSGFELAENSDIQVVGLPTDMSVNKSDVIQISSDSVADNFMSKSSDSESSMANLTNLSMEKTWVPSADADEKGKKRKIESVTGMVTAEVSLNDDTKVFHFPISLGLSYLENEVSQSFKLNDKKFRLKYIDKDDDLILITLDEDLELAMITTGNNNMINLTCLLD